MSISIPEEMFFAALHPKGQERERLDAARKLLVVAVRHHAPKGDYQKYWYKHYSDLAYASALGASAAQVRKRRKLPRREPLWSALSRQEMCRLAEAQEMISLQLRQGMDYRQIKAAMGRWRKDTILSEGGAEDAGAGGNLPGRYRGDH